MPRTTLGTRAHWKALAPCHSSPSKARAALSVYFLTCKMDPSTSPHCDLEGPFGSHPFRQCFGRNQGVKGMSTGSAARHLLHIFPTA